MCNQREFLGAIREDVIITESKDLDISLCVKVNLRLATPTPAVIDNVDRLTDTNDNWCDSSGSPVPFINGSKIRIVFDDKPFGTPTMIVGVLTKLVPNPNFLECSHECN